MHRCLYLASQGAGKVAPNPMVGAVLVYNDHIIGEGFHKQFGGPHAEVNCIDAVAVQNRHLVKESTLYVSLEPCAHFGKTPPCSALIIRQQVKKVVIGCVDVFKEVAGKGIHQLQQAGIEVVTGVLEKECIELNKRFFVFHEKKRPYVVLKWAQTTNGIIGVAGERLLVSNVFTNREVHKWRSEEAAILIGTRTAIEDDPQLTSRYWKGSNPLRVIIDRQLILPVSLRVFDEASPTLIFNEKQNREINSNRYIKLPADNFTTSMLDDLYGMGIQSLLVEGGRQTLQSFIGAGVWDEARVITNTVMYEPNGVSAPELTSASIVHYKQLANDRIDYYRPLAIP